MADLAPTASGPSATSLAGRADAEARLLVGCVRRDPDPGLPAALRALGSADWGGLVHAAEWHGVGPLLYHRLRGLPDLEIPSGANERLRDLYHHCLVRNLAIEAQLAELLQALARAGHPVLVLKGPVLARIAYEDPALRPMYDLDLLARPDEVDAAYAVLEELGYRPAALSVPFTERHHRHPLAREDAVSVEVHRGLAPVDSPFLRNLPDLWDRAAHTRVGGFELPHPAPDDMLLHLCVHAACNHALQVPLLTICDLDTLIVRTGDTLPWKRFVATANDARVGPFAYVLLRMTETLFGTPVPATVLASLRHEPRDEEMPAVALEYIFAGPERLPTMVADIRRAPSVSQRLGALWRGLFPPITQMRKIYGLAPDSRIAMLCYAWRPFDLAVRRGPWLLGALLRGPTAMAALEHDRQTDRVRAWAQDQGARSKPATGDQTTKG